MKRIFTIASLGIVFLTLSCVKDKGSYDLKEINEIEITGVENEEGYNAISYVDRLAITPEIKGTLDGAIEGDKLGNYEFKWYVKDADLLAPKRTVIGTEKDLDYLVELDPGTYTLYYSVKDKNTELEWISAASLNVATSFTTGFLLLGEESDGRIRMDMITMPAGKDTTVVKRVFDNELGLKGAENLIFTGRHYRNQNLFLITGDGTHNLTSGGSFELYDEAGPQFFTTLDVKRPIKIKMLLPLPYRTSSNSGSSRGFITEDAIYFASIITGQYMKNPINRYSATSKDLFIPFPCMFYDIKAYSTAGLFYDITNEQFVTHGSSLAYSSYCKTLQDGNNDPFPWNQKQLGRTLLYGENLFDTYRSSRAIMIDKDENLTIYGFQASMTPTKLLSVDIDPEIAKGISKDSKFAFYSNNFILLYTVGSQLWGYNYNPSVNRAVMLKDYGKPITYLACEYISGQNANHFIIATYDEAANEAVISKFEMNPDANSIEMAERERDVWKTDMKVVKAEFKSAY